MKTATITWVKYNNYGTQLQEYALQHTLYKFGVENDIIFDGFCIPDYYLGVKNTALKKNNMNYYTQRFFRGLKLIYSKKQRETRKNNIKLDRAIAQHKQATDLKFQEFKNKHLKIKYFNDLNELKSNCDNYDLFIAGSDQTWSTIVYNPFYYINFTDKKKIAYAVSIGSSQIPKQFQDEIKKNIKDFSFISTREESAKNALLPLYNKKITDVLDPTLLLQRNEWNNILIAPKTSGYILCYFLESKDWYYNYAIKMSKLLNIEVKLIPNRVEHLSFDFGNIDYPGPSEFLGLINNASLVITDSYHGLIFSTIFEKDFVLIKRFDDNSELNQNSRIFNLLNILQLNNNFITEKEANLSDICSPNYTYINKIIDEKRQISFEFLKGAITLDENYK